MKDSLLFDGIQLAALVYAFIIIGAIRMHVFVIRVSVLISKLMGN